MPRFLKRHRERRLLRARRRDREDLLLELGALVFELHRQGRRAPELLQAQAAALDVVDQDVRALEGTLVVAEGEGELEPTDWSETGEWQEPEGGWPETGEWQPTSDWPAEAEPLHEPEDVGLGETQEWQAPSEDEQPERAE